MKLNGARMQARRDHSGPASLLPLATSDRSLDWQAPSKPPGTGSATLREDNASRKRRSLFSRLDRTARHRFIDAVGM
eukprot:15455234-Alexandrium_andersonii.AAC.1